MRPYSAISEELKPDGALRDFYVYDLGDDCWQQFLDYVRPLIGPASFHVDGEIAPLPESISEISRIRQTQAPCLSIPVGAGFICCHFFSDTELELDFVPNDYQGEEAWRTLRAFFAGVCTLLGRSGIVCHENAPEFLIDTIEPESCEQSHPANREGRPP